MAPRLLLVGCGKMGEALLGGWVQAGFGANEILVVEADSQKAAGIADRFGCLVLCLLCLNLGSPLHPLHGTAVNFYSPLKMPCL